MMHLAGTTRRPKVSEILQMPRAWFQRVRAGAIITLGEKVKDSAGNKTTETSRGRGPPA